MGYNTAAAPPLHIPATQMLRHTSRSTHAKRARLGLRNPPPPPTPDSASAASSAGTTPTFINIDKLQDQVQKLFGKKRVADSSEGTYERAMNSYVEFCDAIQKDAGTEETSRLYVAHMTLNKRAPSTIRGFKAAFCRHYNVDHSFFPDFLDHNVEMEAGPRETQQAEPLPFEMVEYFLAVTNTKDLSFGDWRDAMIVVLGFTAMLRASDICALVKDDVTVKGSKVTIKFTSGRKAHRDEVPQVSVVNERIARAVTTYLGKLPPTTTDAPGVPLFPACHKWGAYCVPVRPLSRNAPNRLVQYFAARWLEEDAVRAAACKFDYEMLNNVSGHSLRRGGAQHLLAKGVHTEEIKRRGGWNSASVDRYLKEMALTMANENAYPF